MNTPEWTKPGIYGALIGAVAISIVGFTWGGWTTDGNAQKMAKSFADEEVTLAMVPVCLNNAETDPLRVSKLATINEASGYSQRTALMDTGWATLPGTEKPNRDLAEACMDGLKLESS